MTYVPWSQIKSKLESEGAKNKAYDSDVDGVFDLAAIPLITRDKLEYPTEDVSFAYLSSINKVELFKAGYTDHIAVITIDNFTDKAVTGWSRDGTRWQGRIDKNGNGYTFELDTGFSTADFVIVRWNGGSCTRIATKSVDLNDNGYILKMSISGSTLKWFRDDLSSPKISATDTSHVAGRLGPGVTSNKASRIPVGASFCKLEAPATPLPKPKAIIESEIIGSGTENDPYRPNLAKLLDKEFDKTIDKYAVTWSAFDHKPEHNTTLITITTGNPYIGEKAISEQIEHAKSKNLKVLKPPRDYNEAVEQYRQLKRDFPEWIAGKDNYTYQTLGHEDFERFQVADTYYGNIVEGYKTDAYKNVPDWEMRRTLAMWKERLKRAEVAKLEAEKHLKKLEEVEKKGW